MYEKAYADIELACGATASFDYGSGISYRCHNCLATVGSMGMPQQCKEAMDMERVIEKLVGNNEKYRF